MRARRALREFRVRGVTTNIPFLRRLLADPRLPGRRGQHRLPHRAPRPGQRTPDDTDRTSAGCSRPWPTSTVNGLARPRPARCPTRSRVCRAASRAGLPAAPKPAEVLVRTYEPRAPAGCWTRSGRSSGPADCAPRPRSRSPTPPCATPTSRLLATRVRTTDLVAAAPATQLLLPGLLSAGVLGRGDVRRGVALPARGPVGATGAAARGRARDLPADAAARAQRGGLHALPPTRVVEAFVAEAARTGVDVFRVFDALNDLEQMRPALRAVQAAGKIAEGTLCYTGDLADPRRAALHAGLLPAPGGGAGRRGSARARGQGHGRGCYGRWLRRRLVTALRAEFDLPVHLHTHDTTGGQLATLIAAARTPAWTRWTPRWRPMSGGTSQVNRLGARRRDGPQRRRSTGLSLAALNSARAVLGGGPGRLRARSRPGCARPTGTVYRHEIPGGQLTNLRQQAISLGLGDRWEEVQELYAVANELLGKPIKVTPTSARSSGDLALFLAGLPAGGVERLRSGPGERSTCRRASWATWPASSGRRPAGFPEPFRTRRGRRPRRRSATDGGADSHEDEAGLAGPRPAGRAVATALPRPLARLRGGAARPSGTCRCMPTAAYLYGLVTGPDRHRGRLNVGVEVVVELEADR